METIIVSILVLVASPAVGSFLAVLVDRLPRGHDVVHAPSACRSCKARLVPLDLVPILSFALLRGRCRTCGATIPPYTLYTELLALGAAILALVAAPTPGAVLGVAAILWVLIALAMTDLIWFRLPDMLTGVLLVLVLAHHLIWGGDGAVNRALTGAAIGLASFWALRIGYRLLRGREGLGLGDVKLMAGLGALVGPFDLAALVFVAAVFALGGALAFGGGMRATRPVPFGTALCAAGACVWLWQMTGG